MGRCNVVFAAVVGVGAVPVEAFQVRAAIGDRHVLVVDHFVPVERAGGVGLVSFLSAIPFLAEVLFFPHHLFLVALFFPACFLFSCRTFNCNCASIIQCFSIYGIY